MNGGEEYFSGPMNAEFASDLKGLWEDDKGIKETFGMSAQYQLIDSAQ